MTDADCLDCKTTSRGTCPVHADSDSVDLEIARLKEELARLLQVLMENAITDTRKLKEELSAELSRLTEENRGLESALRHACGIILSPAEDIDEADAEWAHNTRTALSTGDSE